MKKRHYSLILIVFSILLGFWLYRDATAKNGTTSANPVCILSDKTKVPLEGDSITMTELISQIAKRKNNPVLSDSALQIIVPKGKRYKIVFEDETFITLRENSSIWMKPDEIILRPLRLEGEALFVLRGDSTYILAGESIIKSYPGIIRVFNRGNDTLNVETFTAKLFLKHPGCTFANFGPQKGIAFKRTGLGDRPYAFFPYESENIAPRWAADNMDFTDASFRQVLEYGEELYKIPFEVENPQQLFFVINARISGGLSLEMFCELASQASGFGYRIEKDRVVFFVAGSM